jgi:predicted phage terminase large subunit-like protein
MLCIQQRCTYGSDLTEYLLELGGWDQVVIPNEYDGKKFIGPLAYPDPRIHLGELMFPERFNYEDTELEKRQKKQHYPAQFNQNPSIEGKSGLHREWFNFWVPTGSLLKDVSPDGTERIRPIRITLPNGDLLERIPSELPLVFEQIVQSWDMACKGNEGNDFVAGHVWGRIGLNTYLLHRDHGNRNFPETLMAVRRVSNRFPCPEKLVEDKANGPAVIDTLKNEIPGLIPVSPAGGKWSRVAAISGYVEAGNVFLPSPDIFPWVWELLSEFAAGRSAKHDDDTDAMTQALKRLYDSQLQSGFPEFRVQPLSGEPSTACHIQPFSILPEWRRFIAVVPNRAAVWIAETPAESFRVYRELDIDRMDAQQVGREIAARSLEELDGMSRVTQIKPGRNAFSSSYDIYLPKTAFACIGSAGSWAEMLEAAILEWDKPEGTWDERQASKALVKNAKFRCEMTEERVEVAMDRLRELLAFAPTDWQAVSYDRKLALALAEKDLGEYHDYMARVEGTVRGEWPKLKFSPGCVQVIAQMGTVRRDKLSELPSFIEALLLAVSAPQKMMRRTVGVRPYLVTGESGGGGGGGGGGVGGGGGRNRGLFARKFALR